MMYLCVCQASSITGLFAAFSDRILRVSSKEYLYYGVVEGRLEYEY